MGIKWIYLNIRRQLKVTIPLIICVFATFSLLSIGIMINSFNYKVTDEIKSNYVTKVKLVHRNLKSTFGNFIENRKVLDDKIIFQLAALDEVDVSNYMIRNISSKNPYIYQINGQTLEEFNKNGLLEINDKEELEALSFLGVNRVSLLYQDPAKIVEGRDFTEEDINESKRVAIINHQLAELKGLKIGDEILIEQIDVINPSVYDGQSFKIVGTYIGNDHYRKGTIFIPTTTKEEYEPLPEILTDDYWYIIDQAVFVLKEPDLADDFIRNADGFYDKEYFSLIADDAEYKQMTSVFDSMNIISNTLSIISFPIGVILLSILIGLSVRARKKEAALLRIIGITKRQVVIYIMLEYLVLIFIAIILGIAIGSTVFIFISGNILNPLKELNLEINLVKIIYTNIVTILRYSLVFVFIQIIGCLLFINYYLYQKPLDVLRSY